MFFIHLNSIKTPEQYSAFLRGKSNDKADYEVLPKAKPEKPFEHIKDWVCYSTAFRSLKITDEYGNFIHINPSTRTLEADLSKGGRYTFYDLPTYKKYTVHLRIISALDTRRIYNYLSETAKEIVVTSDEEPMPAVREHIVQLMAKYKKVKFYGPNSEIVKK